MVTKLAINLLREPAPTTIISKKMFKKNFANTVRKLKRICVCEYSLQWSQFVSHKNIKKETKMKKKKKLQTQCVS